MTRAEHAARPRRESLRKRLGRVAAQIAARDEHRCVYCGATAESTGAPLHFDHLVPRSAGGADTADNLVLACRSCNCRRHDLSLTAWAAASKPELTFTAAAVRAQARRPLPEIATFTRGRKAA